MQTQNCNIERSMKDTEISLLLMESSKPIFVDDLNIFEEEILANQTTLHSTQPIRNLPNILRNNNTRIYKSNKTLMLDKIDTSFISEDLNTSFELNTILSNIDLEMEASYSKITSPKSHHQRKQVHNPLDLSYDMPDRNNNKDKNMLRKVNQLNPLHISSYKKNTSLKRLKYNKQKGNLCNKKPRRLTGHKSNCKTRNKFYKKSYEKLDFDTELTISQVNMEENVSMQDVNDISSNILTESIYEPNTSNYINDLNDIGAKSVESSNVFHCNNENYKFEKKYDINYNPIISGNSKELMQNKNVFGENLTNYEFPIMTNDFEKELINKDITSNFLLKPKVLYTCTCANCMLQDKDIIFYEEQVSTSINKNMETELFTYDFNTGDYYGDILGDNWLEELDNKNLYHEKFEETHIIEKNLCTSNDSITKLVENNANISLMEQAKSQNLQSYHIDKAQNNNNVESCSTEIVTQPNGPINFFNSSENINIFNEMNLENSLIKENKIVSQDKSFIQTTISADVPLFKSKEISQANKQDLYFIQCAQCERIFHEKHQFRKHFTHCDFYKEDFKCHICNKIYRHKSSLAQHLRIVHHVLDGPYEKYYTCNKCLKSYVRFRAFQKHILLHDD
ncbi:Zinc finger protein 37 [Camponotus japonicus]